MERLTITYKICMEAEDISFSRIQSSIAFVQNMLVNSGNSYLQNAKTDDESDLDEYTLCFYVDDEICEEPCMAQEDAKSFAFDLAGTLETIAAAHSYMDIEGSLVWQYGGERKVYRFRSESGMDYCDIMEEKEQGA